MDNDSGDLRKMHFFRGGDCNGRASRYRFVDLAVVYTQISQRNRRAIFVLSVKLVPLAEKLNVSLMVAIKRSYIRLVPV